MEKTGSLAIDKVEILGFGDHPAKLFHLQQFAFNHLLGQADQQVENLQIALFKSDAEGLHIQPVARQHAF